MEWQHSETECNPRSHVLWPPEPISDAGGDGEARSTAPLFETFWQGRLIPGSGLDSVPFIEAVRAKLRGSASGKDYVPDEVFRRIRWVGMGNCEDHACAVRSCLLPSCPIPPEWCTDNPHRGALFFGPAWRVTRNKLTFRDPLQQLLAAATPGDRGLDRRLREWLRDCHTRLDRIIRFEGPADVELKVSPVAGSGLSLRLSLRQDAAALPHQSCPRAVHKGCCLAQMAMCVCPAQALVRKELGEAMTGFKCANDGSRIIVAGDVVRLATKPAALGRVKYFAVPQVRGRRAAAGLGHTGRGGS